MNRKILTAVAAPTALAAVVAASVLSTAGPAAAAPVAATRPATTTAASSTVVWPVVKEGSRGEAVVALQYLLTARGFNPDGVDGVFGAHTRAALVRFQASKKLSADGVAGNQTWSAVVIEIRSGNTGDAVRALQSELNANGHRLTVDGIYGALTLAAARSFQARYHLAGAGVINEATWNALVSHGG